MRFQSPRGDFGFLKLEIVYVARNTATLRFQSPRGDFGFLKELRARVEGLVPDVSISIPSRGFWFFEADFRIFRTETGTILFQSPRGDFGFLKGKGKWELRDE